MIQKPQLVASKNGLIVNNLRKSLSHKQIVRDVSLRLQRGKTPQHLKANGDVRPGLYVQTGNKRVYWARQEGYTHIEGYYVTNREDKAKIRSKLHIPHTEIPR